MSAAEIIAEIMDLDERIARLREQLDELPATELEQTLREQLAAVISNTGEHDPLPLGLVRLTDLVCGLNEGAAAILAPGLDSPSTHVRQLVGEALLTLTDEGLEAILPAVDHALYSGGAAGAEMPFILAMIDDDAGVPRIIERFLDSDDPEVVASAIEALADAGDRDTVALLKEFERDQRSVSLDGGHGNATATLGELAQEAIEVITVDMDEED